MLSLKIKANHLKSIIKEMQEFKFEAKQGTEHKTAYINNQWVANFMTFFYPVKKVQLWGGSKQPQKRKMIIFLC